MRYIYLGVAVCLMTIAHVIRAYRWGLFIGVYEEPDKGRLMKAISLGYLVNYIVPFKMGELFRAWFASRRMRTGKALAFSTVIVDRVLDIILVGAIFLALAFGGNDKGKEAAGFYVFSALGIIAFGMLCWALKPYIKRGIVSFAKIFNTRLEGSILRFSFSLISDFKNILNRISVAKLLASTGLMWGLYVLSYYTFSLFVTRQCAGRVTWADVFVSLFSQSSVLSSIGKVSTLWMNGTIDSESMIIFMVMPILLLWVISFLFKPHTAEYSDNDNQFINLLPHLDLDERLAFLEKYFSNSSKQYVDSFLELNRNITIIRDYSAGSNATTMLCMDGNSTFFRKYAFGKDGDKLFEQISWIENNMGKIPLPQILRQGKTDLYCFYDMPYESHCVGLFEYVHSMPVESGWSVIRQALERLEHSIYECDVKPAEKEIIDKYISEKVDKNLDKLKKDRFIIELQKYDTVLINGVEYANLKAYSKYLKREHLEKIFANDEISVIHGDLTIENIICTRAKNGTDDYYIIDPNTGNIHNSPNLDYAKLLQSLHGGYEFLMSAKDVAIHENRVDFLFAKSSAYNDLHKRLRTYMTENLGEERTRSIYYHEIIHWLRLMPYKIDKDEKRAVLFYAGMLMVMNDVIRMYGDM